MELIFLHVLPAQDPHAHPHDVGEAVRAVHTACDVPVASFACHRRSADDRLSCVDGTCGPVASRDPHVTPFVW
jgi:hypothetical protein